MLGGGGRMGEGAQRHEVLATVHDLVQPCPCHFFRSMTILQAWS